MTQTVAEFKKEADTTTAKFSLADRKARSLANLHGVKMKNTGVWRRCRFPNVPCGSRIVVSVVSFSSEWECKSLVCVCSEVKYCLLLARPKGADS